MRSSEGSARRQNNREPIKHISPSVAFQHGPEPPSAGTGASRSQAAADPKRAEAERKAIADAQKIVAIWDARQAGGRALWFYPTIGAAIAGGLPWLTFSCPGCGQLGSVDLRTLNRHPGAAISNLISSVSCRRRICARPRCAGSM
jgi:hypothetical protein